MTQSPKAVFLSYASQDAEAAKRICEALRAAGIEVWFDQSELRGGDAWDRQIRQQIRECALFIPIISANTEARLEGYFRREWNLAVARLHGMADEMAFLVPVVIDGTSDQGACVPEQFGVVQWSRLPGGDAGSAFAEHLSDLLSPKRLSKSPTVASATRSPFLGVSAPGPIPDKSIAVLPFTNLSDDKDNEYFSDGLAEEILNALSHIPELRVSPRMSSFFFKGRAAELSEIATRLRVANVLDGTVRRSGSRIRVTVQLIDVRNGIHLWSERYDRQMEDIFEVQDDLARAITDRLKVTLVAGLDRSTFNLAAYDLYLKGRHYWYQRTPAGLRSAIQCFERAIELDPQYAIAYAGLADCYGILHVYGIMPVQDCQPQAKAAVIHATALAPLMGEVNCSRGYYVLAFERAWREAGPYFEKAIAINPGSSFAQVYYGMFLMTAGRTDEAAAQAMLACQLDPLSALVHGLAGVILGSLGHFETAGRVAQDALELQPDHALGLSNRGLALCGLGRFNEAIEPLERAASLSPAPHFLGHLGFGYARAGRAADALRLLRELEDRGNLGEYVPSFTPLEIYVGLGDLAAMRTTFARAMAEPTSAFTIRWSCGHALQAFRSDPEIDRLHLDLFGW